MEEKDVLKIPAMLKNMGASDVARFFGVTKRTIYRHIINLKKAGHKIKRGKPGRKKINYNG